MKTRVHTEEKIIEMIVSISEEFLQSAGSKPNYQKIADDILEISGAQYVAFNLYDEEGLSFSTVAISAPKEIIKKVSSLLGFPLIGRKWKNDPNRAEKIKDQNITHFNTLRELVGDVVAVKTISFLEKIYHVSETVVVKIMQAGIMIGDFTLMMAKDTSFKHHHYVEIYTRLIGFLITYSRDEAKIIESETSLRHVFKAMTDPLFLLEQNSGDILDVNEAACITYGYERQQMLQLKIMDMSAEPEQTKKSLKDFTAFMPFRRHKKKDGTVFFVEVTASLFQLKGRNVIAASMRDVTERKKTEDILREERERLANIIEGTHISTWEWNIGTGQIIFNLLGSDFMGYDLEEISPIHVSRWEKYVHPDDLKKCSKMLKKILAGESDLLNIEARLKHKDGSWVWHLDRAKVTTRTPQGKPLTMSGSYIDINERKIAEEALRESEEKFRLLATQMQFGMAHHRIICDQKGKPVDYLYLSTNKSFERLTGLRGKDIIGKTVLTVLPNTEKYWIERYGKVARSGAPDQFEAYSAEFNKYYSVSAYRTKPDHFAVIFDDVSQKKKADDEIREREHFLRAIMETTQDGFWVLDKSGAIKEVNESYSKMSGYSRAELLSMNISNLEAVEKPKDVINHIRFVLKKGSDVFESLHRKKDGSIFDVKVSVLKILQKTDDVLVCFCTDITDRKRAEEEIRRSEENHRRLFETMAQGVVYQNKEGQIISANPAAERILGLDFKEMENKTTAELSFKVIRADGSSMDASEYPAMAALHSKKPVGPFVMGILKPDQNEPIWLSVNAIPLFRSETKMPYQVYTTFEDITERKQAKENLIHLSYHDQVTGLYNRRFFEEELKRMDVKRNLPLSIVMADINGLKLINDSFGHFTGDQLLIKTAEVIRLGCRSDDVIARIGGDEFAFMLAKTDVIEALKIIGRIKRLAAKEKVSAIDLSVSFGHATKERTDQNISEVMIHAENMMYRNKLYERASTRSKTIEIIMNALFEKSHRESFHSKRVSSICQAIASNMGLEKEDIDQIRMAGLVHDIGKIGIEETILNKSGRLTRKERKEMERHCEKGWRILSSANEFLELAAFVLEHHERYDGNGYPNGLKGNKISVPAMIIAVADAYDAMTSERTYQKAKTKDEALAEVKNCSGTQFDPATADVFIRMLQKGFDV